MDSKGNFGKAYSPGHGLCRLAGTPRCGSDDICAELFRDIDKDTVDFVDNYDGTMQEPTLLPTTFPNVLVSANHGHRRGHGVQPSAASTWRRYAMPPLRWLKNPDADLMETLKGPDFPTGGQLLYDREALADDLPDRPGELKGAGQVALCKGRTPALKSIEIPYSTTVEAIMDKVAELVKAGKAEGDRRHAG